MITTNFNKRTGILETTIVGEISIEEVFDYIKTLRENKELPTKLKVFSDASKAKFSEKVGIKDLQEFLEENETSLKQKDFIYDAFVISSSFEMALGMLYKELNRIVNYKFSVFSTKDAAINWLKKY